MLLKEIKNQTPDKKIKSEVEINRKIALPISTIMLSY